jgi:hypothetical protein
MERFRADVSTGRRLSNLKKSVNIEMKDSLRRTSNPEYFGPLLGRPADFGLASQSDYCCYQRKSSRSLEKPSLKKANVSERIFVGYLKP